MGGGGGGYDRPSDSGGSGGDSSDSDEDESSRVPPPDPDEETTGDDSDESNGTSDGANPEDPPATGGGGGGGAPVTGPGEGPDGGPEDDNSGPEEEEPEDPEDGGGRNTKDSDKPVPPDSEDERDSNGPPTDEQDDQQNRSEESEDREQKREDDTEDDDNDQEEDEEDECLIAELAILHSTNPEPLEDAAVDDICSVRLREGAVCVVDDQGRSLGAIAEPWVGTLKECIEQGRQYRARILDIDGGKCEVRVINKCLLDQDVNLTDINSAVRSQLRPGLSLSIEATTGEVVVVTEDGSRVSKVPGPWARLLSECIDQGQSYQAEVRDVTPEYCIVNIQNTTGDE